MSVQPEAPPSTGKELIAAYRAARLSLRPVLRTSLHQSHVARRAARINAIACPAADAPAPAEPLPPPPECVAPQETTDLASVFASLVNLSADAPAPEPGGECAPDQAESPAGTVPVPYDPPLAEIGFGPGMLIRLSQIGVHGTLDLARADAAVLRAALGEISRLVDVEAWIASARHSVAIGRPAEINSAA